MIGYDTRQRINLLSARTRLLRMQDSMPKQTNKGPASFPPHSQTVLSNNSALIWHPPPLPSFLHPPWLLHYLLQIHRVIIHVIASSRYYSSPAKRHLAYSPSYSHDSMKHCRILPKLPRARTLLKRPQRMQLRQMQTFPLACEDQCRTKGQCQRAASICIVWPLWKSLKITSHNANLIAHLIYAIYWSSYLQIKKDKKGMCHKLVLSGQPMTCNSTQRYSALLYAVIILHPCGML